MPFRVYKALYKKCLIIYYYNNPGYKYWLFVVGSSHQQHFILKVGGVVTN